ncbi:MAG: DUF748 domain-containing protein [Gammaproteobacteria bacterium]|nr:DUF748 domain-containing protein [Gammaproteobacteria bacterium]
MVCAIIVYGLLGFFLAPYLLERNLVATMQQEFDAELRVEKIEINPFVLSLRINGLELDNPEGEPTARIQEIFTNFQLSSLFRFALTFDEIRLSSPELFVTRDKSGNMDFAYLTQSADNKADDKAANGDEDSGLLPALVFNFTIEDWVINWTDQFPVEPLQARFGPINIGIKELNTLPDRVGQQSVVIVTENSGTLSWNGDLQLNPLRSSGRASIAESRFPLASAYIRHQTGLEIVNGSADFELDYEVDQTNSGQIKASIINFNLTLTDVVINSFADGTGFDFAGPDQQILKLPRIHLADGQFHWPEQTVTLGSISVDNPQIDLSRAEDGVFNVEPRPTNSAEQNVTNVADETVANDNDQNSSEGQWQLSVGNLAINNLAVNLIDKTVAPEAKLGVTDFNLDISDISNLPGKRFPTRLNLQALSGGRLSLQGEVSVLPEPLFDFDVAIDAVQLAGAHPYIKQHANLSMDSGAINLGGHISGSALEPLLFNGDLEIVDLAIAESINQERLASWKSFRADKIALSLAKRQLDISRIHFDQLYGDILINQDSSLNIGQVQKVDTGATVSEPSEVTAKVETGEGNSELKIRIGDIVLANASADFQDLSLPLPFAVKIDALNGKMTTISTESSEPSTVALEGKVDEYGFARISGTVTPLDPAANTDLLVAFENISVPKFTPYSIPFAGREVASGKLDLKLGYQVHDGQLAGENSIILSDFELGKKVPHPDAMDLPLGLAVALLKDVNGKIDIDLPVRGNVNEPDFNYGGVVLKALGDLLVKIVLSPFTALGSLLGMEASELEHVKFLDGRADLTPPEMEKTGKLAEALVLRPELQLTIAGVADAVADGLALRTAELDKILELRITELTATSDPSIQYADLRRMALEQLYSEQPNTGAAFQTLEELQMQFTTLVQIEGQDQPAPSFDSLAYAGELRRQLIDSRVIDENDLASLATARAEALKMALLAITDSLQDRVLITENKAITRDDGGSIEMQVKLGAKSD